MSDDSSTGRQTSPEVITAGNDRRLRPEDKISDWYLPANEPLDGWFFPGRVPVRDFQNLYDMATQLAERSRKRTADGYEEFVVKEGDRSYRGHRIQTVSGPIFALRRMPSVVPKMENLGLDKSIVEVLLHPHIAKHGGLIIVCGETGQGKSTTLAAVIMARVSRLGAFCLTIEDPPEMPLHGAHGAGLCYQTEVRIGAWGDAMRGAMRCYPAISGSMLYVGETRDPETAAEVLRAAINGHLVLTTIHANDVSTCIQRFVTLAKGHLASDEEARSVLASALRLVMHQELEFIPGVNGEPSKRKLKAKFAISVNDSSALAQAIRDPKSGNVKDVEEQQLVQLRMGGVGKLLSSWK